MMNKYARKMADYVKKVICKPKTLPSPANHEIPKNIQKILFGFRQTLKHPLRWTKRHYRCKDTLDKYTGFCPMGLLPHSRCGAPSCVEHFEYNLRDSGLGQVHVSAFGKWWDNQTDPVSAVNEIWGKSK